MPTSALLILICFTSLSAACALVSWKAASGAARLRKQMRDAQIEIGELSSTVESLTESHKRLRSREGMRDLRARRAAPSGQETKAQLLARLGMAGKVGPEFAKAQLSLNADHPN
jgi:hypothetical protein